MTQPHGRALVLLLLLLVNLYLPLSKSGTRALIDRDALDQDTIHRLFLGLEGLVDFQHKCLLDCEAQYLLPWEEQRWGKCITLNLRLPSTYLWCPCFSRTVQEANFAVYELVKG